eukprot:7273670-Pyramimonas_sp.AAC.1
MVSVAADAHGARGVQLRVKHYLPIAEWRAESPRLPRAVVGKRGLDLGLTVFNSRPIWTGYWLARKMFAIFRISWSAL